MQASPHLGDLIAGRTVRCEAHDRDGYGRIVSLCRAGGAPVGQVLVQEGLARARREYSDAYVPMKEAVRAAGLGIWQAPARRPWEYPADRWERAVAASPGGCPIRGNIAANGEGIYHTPWSRYYGRTRVSEAVGEAWFCDEAAARAAGWPARGAEARRRSWIWFGRH